MMKKIVLALVIAFMSAYNGNCQWRGIEPSSAKAKVMETLSDFTSEKPLPSFRDVVYAHRSDMDLRVRIIRPDNDIETLRPCITQPGSSRISTRN